MFPPHGPFDRGYDSGIWMAIRLLWETRQAGAHEETKKFSSCQTVRALNTNMHNGSAAGASKTFYGGQRRLGSLPPPHRWTLNGHAVSWLVVSPRWANWSRGMQQLPLGSCWPCRISSLKNIRLRWRMGMMLSGTRFARLLATSYSPSAAHSKASKYPRLSCICCQQRFSGRIMQILWLIWLSPYKESSRLDQARSPIYSLTQLSSPLQDWDWHFGCNTW